MFGWLKRRKVRKPLQFTPEERARLDQLHKDIAQELVDNLNRNVVARHGPEKSEEPPPKT